MTLTFKKFGDLYRAGYFDHVVEIFYFTNAFCWVWQVKKDGKIIEGGDSKTLLESKSLGSEAFFRTRRA